MKRGLTLADEHFSTFLEEKNQMKNVNQWEENGGRCNLEIK